MEKFLKLRERIKICVNYTIISISNNKINKPKIAWFSKFCKIKFKWGSILKRNVKIWLFQKVEKSQSKVGVGCGNDIVFEKLAEEMNWNKK